MCPGCPLQTLADFFPCSETDLHIWHQGQNQPDRVMLSVTHRGEQLAVTDETCRGAVAKLLQEMDSRRVGDCIPVLVE